MGKQDWFQIAEVHMKGVNSVIPGLCLFRLPDPFVSNLCIA